MPRRSLDGSDFAKEEPMAGQRQDQPRRRGPTLSGEEARQGEIILRTPARRAIFIGGLVLAAIVGVLLLLYKAVLL